MSQDVRVLIMDEPTAALSAHEVRRLFRQVEQLRSNGVAILFITHRLDEVFQISDRVSVFRDGRHISTRPVADTNEAIAVKEMVGRDLGEFFVRTRHELGDVALSVDEPRTDPASSAASASTSTTARCSASPAWSAPDAPTSDWRCSASPPPTRGGSRSAGRQVTIKIATGRRSARHRLPLRGPQEARAEHAAIGRRQHLAADPPPLHERRYVSSTRLPSARSPNDSAPSSHDPHAEPRDPGRQPLREATSRR